MSLTSVDTFPKECERYQQKLETTNDKEKTQRKAAEIEAAVATELVLVVDAQRKKADTQLEVSVWVRDKTRGDKRRQHKQSIQETRQTTLDTQNSRNKKKKRKKVTHIIGPYSASNFGGKKLPPPTPSRFTNLFSSSSQLKFLPPQHAQIFVSHWLFCVLLFFNEISISKVFLVVFVPISQDLLAKKGEAGKAIIKLEEQLAEFKQQEKKAVEEMKGPGKGRPKSLAFENRIRYGRS